jgi:ABC-type sugar transport system ATPase subunit
MAAMGGQVAPLVEMRDICKHFGGVQALDRAELTLYPGEIHALVGDNAAGKSTLIKILSGALAMDEGRIVFEGRPVQIREPRDAKALGIETVYQDLALADNLDVPSNIFLGRELLRPGLGGLILDLKRMEREARLLLARLRIHIPSVRLRTRALSGGQRQSVAIARCMYFNARVVILDEPTAALGVAETAKVHELVRDLKSHGLAVLMISHNLNHVFGVSDRITVLKAGRIVGSRVVAATTQEEVLRMILTGRATNGTEPAGPASDTPVLPAPGDEGRVSPA